MCECVHNVVDFRYRHVVCVLVLSQCVTSVSCVCLCVGVCVGGVSVFRDGNGG